MKSKYLLAVLLALCSIAGCNAFVKNPDGSITVSQPVLTADIAVIRAVVAAEPPGPNRDKILALIDSGATFEAIAAALSTAPAIEAKLPPATAAKVRAVR